MEKKDPRVEEVDLMAAEGKPRNWKYMPEDVERRLFRRKH